MVYELPVAIREFLLYVLLTIIRKLHTTTMIITIIFEIKWLIYLYYREWKNKTKQTCNLLQNLSFYSRWRHLKHSSPLATDSVESGSNTCTLLNFQRNGWSISMWAPRLSFLASHLLKRTNIIIGHFYIIFTTYFTTKSKRRDQQGSH